MSLIKNGQLFLRIIITILCIIIILFPIVKPPFYTYYISNKTGSFIPPATNSETLNYYNQSIPARVGVFRLGEYTFFIYLTILIVLLYQIYKSQNLMLGIVSSIILSPISWQHYFAVLFPIYIVFYFKTKIVANKILLFIAYFFFWIEFPFLHTEKVNLFTSLLSSHYLLSAIILFVLIYKQQATIHPASKRCKI